MSRDQRQNGRTEPPAWRNGRNAYINPLRRLYQRNNRNRIEEDVEPTTSIEPSTQDETQRASLPPLPQHETNAVRTAEQDSAVLEHEEQEWQVAGTNGRAVRPVNPRAPGAPPAGLDRANWRDSMGAATTSRPIYRPPNTVSGRARNGTRQSNGGANNRSLNTNALKPGTIIAHKDLHHYHGDVDAVDNSQIFEDVNGELCIVKPRYFVVRSVHAQHFNELPIYTYNKLGISRKSEAVKKEHVSLRPYLVEKANFVGQNEYEPLEMEGLCRQKEDMSPYSVVHFTEDMSSNVHTNYRILGYLTEESMRNLERLRASLNC